MPTCRTWRTGPSASRLDRVDQRAHPPVQRGGLGDGFLVAFAAFGGVAGGAVLGRLTTLPANSASRLPARSARLGAAVRTPRPHSAVRWVFDQSKWMPADIERKAREPSGIAVEQRRSAGSAAAPLSSSSRSCPCLSGACRDAPLLDAVPRTCPCRAAMDDTPAAPKPAHPVYAETPKRSETRETLTFPRQAGGDRADLPQFPLLAVLYPSANRCCRGC